jgi:hypothetical protein
MMALDGAFINHILMQSISKFKKNNTIPTYNREG